jgi:hypothetical protein
VNPAPAATPVVEEARYDVEIKGHEDEGRKYRWRAEYAKQGYLLDGRDEQRDAAYRKEHGDLIDMALRTGRTHYPAEGATTHQHGYGHYGL